MSALRERLNTLKTRLEEVENTPSELTKDALLAELREFYDMVKNVDTNASVQPVTEVVIEEQKEEEVAEDPEPQPQPTPVAEAAEAEPEQESTVVEPMAEVNETIEAVSDGIDKDEEPMEAVTEPVGIKKPLIADAETAEKPNDERILAGQLSRKPLEDLRTGIPLNEKFGIIRNLFKGNASDYGDAVLKLNNAASTTEMQHYLDLLQQRFGWDLQSEAYQMFSVYVERKMLTLQTSDANADQ